MTTITRDQAQKIIDAADEVITALAGTNDDVHPDNSRKMCDLWDDLNDRYAPPEVNASNPVMPVTENCGRTNQKRVLSVINDSKRGSMPKRPITLSSSFLYQTSRNFPTGIPLYKTFVVFLTKPSAERNRILTKVLVSAAS